VTSLRYLIRSLVHYRFAYLGVLAGAVLGATVLLGALFAGDSVSASLRQIGEKRIGRTTHLLAAGDRFFRQDLASEFAAAAQVRTAPVFYARGTATHGTSQAAANQVQLVGVTDDFWSFAPAPTTISLAEDALAINDTLARRLQVAVGDSLILRVQKSGILAGNAPVPGGEASLQSLRGTVAVIVGDDAFGRFNLEATQIPPASVFLPIGMLQAELERPERANLMLVDVRAAAGPEPDDAPARTVSRLADTLARSVQLADYGLALQWLERAAVFELTSDRIFIAPELARAVVAAVPAAQPVLSYLVNEFRVGDRTTPYSIATATTSAAAPFLPPTLGDREIVLNEWLAEDLQAAAGDDIQLAYYQTGAAGTLVEQSATFRVHSVIPLQGLAADGAWMPAFPGISDTPDQSDWDPGLPLDLARIRDQDEKYWDDYRGAPKAYLSPAAGEAIWSTRWGSTTALRIPAAHTDEAALVRTLLGALRPELNQLQWRDLQSGAQEAAQSPVDFGGLFVGMSFFLIAAALGLVAMLFQLSLLQRDREDALLGAVGVPGKTLLRWRLAEGTVILLVGCAGGLALAVAYTRGVLRFLGTIWSGTGTGAAFVFATTPASIAAGSGVFLLLSLLAIWLAIRRQTRRTLSIRLAAHPEETGSNARVRRSSMAVGGAAGVVALLAVGLSGRALPAQAAFYLAGFALLTAGIALCRWWLAQEAALVVPPSGGSGASADRLKPGLPTGAFDAGYLGRLNLKARRARNLTVVGLISTAVFMVLSVASFRKDIGADWLERSSGTGGFTFWVETTAALNAARDGESTGFEGFDRQAEELGEVIPLRVGVGDNANCFNLNTTAQPRLLAVDSGLLAARKAFRLKVPGDGVDSAQGWNVLQSSVAGGPIPALVDETTLLWALKRKVGDVLSYLDEHGRPFEVQIAGTIPDSIFQGHLIVDEQRFLERFPSHPGYSVFLADARDPADLPEVRRRLEAALADAGGRVDLTRDVLAAFHQIENTYIAIFNVLGSLGVILGSLGLTIVVARNLRERRGEFAVMTAIGIPRPVLARMVFSEFGRLVLWGIGIGTLAAALAVWPNLTSLPAAPAVALVGSLLAGIVALNLACGWAVFRWSLRDLHPGAAHGML